MIQKTQLKSKKMELPKVKRGWHIIAEFMLVDPELLKTKKLLREFLYKAASEAGFTVVGESFYQFKPFGATGVLVLTTSHISAHTWPEHKYVAIDVYSCAGKRKAIKALKVLESLFKPKEKKVQIIERYK